MLEGFDVHVPKGYIYFATAFSMAMGMVDMRVRKRRTALVKSRKQVRATNTDTKKTNS